MNNAPRGEQRERALPLDAYFSDNYFALPQLCSLCQQIHEIHALQPTDILEIGIGNGFTSSFFKRANYDVTTVDINPALQPDICAPLGEVAGHVHGRKFDLVVCCEVLEHMPFEQFESNLDSLRELGRRLFMTLPNYCASVGATGILRVTPHSVRLLDLNVNIRRKKTIVAEHFWEVGSSRKTSRRAIVRALEKRYDSVRSMRLALNPHHFGFYAT